MYQCHSVIGLSAIIRRSDYHTVRIFVTIEAFQIFVAMDEDSVDVFSA